MVKKLDLHRRKADNCIQCINASERKSRQDVDGYCQVINPSDQVGVRCVGDWGADKVTFISTYVDIVGKAMKRHKKMPLYYVEICSGPGRCVDFTVGEEFDGTSLAVLTTEGAKHYTKLFFFDLNPKTVQNLRLRIDTSDDIPQEVKDNTVVSMGDYTNPRSIIEVLEANIPSYRRGLNIVFVDPTDMSVPYELYSSLMRFGNGADFIINFADGTDLKRNIKKAFKDPDSPSQKKYGRVLENTRFFTDPINVEYAKKGDLQKLSDEFENIFTRSFKARGYDYILDDLRIKWYYKLLFLSKHELGAKFWYDACKRTAPERENCQPVFNF